MFKNVGYISNQDLESWQMRMLVLLLVVFAVVALVVAGSLQIPEKVTRWYLVGFLSCGSLVSMVASPLFVIVSFKETQANSFMCSALLIA